MAGKSGYCTASMGPHIAKETTLNIGPPKPPASFQARPWSSPSWAVPQQVPWASSCQVAPPAATTSNMYSTPVGPFIPPLPSGPEINPWPPMQPSSPGILRPPPLTVTPPTPALVTVATPPPPPPIHRGTVCDVCDKVIEGVRHKCLDCYGTQEVFILIPRLNACSSDYDLCTSCISTGAAERHDPFHEFFEITEPGRVIVHTLDAPRRVPSSDNPAPAPAAAPPPADHVVHSARCDLCDSRIEGYRYVGRILLSS
jgi:next to BRCA1 gene 1 protein